LVEGYVIHSAAKDRQAIHSARHSLHLSFFKHIITFDFECGPQKV